MAGNSPVPRQATFAPVATPGTHSLRSAGLTGKRRSFKPSSPRRPMLLDPAIGAGMFTEPGAAALHPTGVLINPGDVAQAFPYLASDVSEHVTGHDLPVDAGLAAG
ncbi:SDR family oxidoreductase [Streptomyces sp. BBFR51]|uniref:SDR family oxidoreductase n=1 Tax=Streptomyces sp. BBFR51 TaxID=3372856 RepID=UPI0037DC11C3